MKIVLVPSWTVVAMTDEQVARVREAAGEHTVVVASGDEAIEEARDAEVLFGRIEGPLMEQAEQVRWIQWAGAGVNKLTANLRDDVILTSGKGIVGPHLAEHAYGLLLALTRGIAFAIRNPGWEHRRPIRALQWEFTDRTMCVVGLGGTGKAMVRRAYGFEFARVTAVEPFEVPEGLVDDHSTPEGMNRLLAEADVVVLTLPLTPLTKNLFDRERFAAMKPGSIIVNVSRGELIDDDALLESLHSGHLGGAGLDVSRDEPLSADHPLYKEPNVVVTPHTAGGSPLRGDRVIDHFCENLRRYLAGEVVRDRFQPERGF